MMEPLVIQNLEILDTLPSGSGGKGGEATKEKPENGNNNNNDDDDDDNHQPEKDQGEVQVQVAAAKKNENGNTAYVASKSAKTSAQAAKQAAAHKAGKSASVEEDEEEGVTIVVGDNDSVSSLDSNDSFALSDDEEVVEMEKPPESYDSPIRRHFKRQGNHQGQRASGAGPKLRELSPLFRKESKRQLQPRRKPRRHERFNPRAAVTGGNRGGPGANNLNNIKQPPRVRASSLDSHFFQNSNAAAKAAASPMPPQRKRTNENIKRPARGQQAHGQERGDRGMVPPPPVFTRNHSSPELLSPTNSRRNRTPVSITTSTPSPDKKFNHQGPNNLNNNAPSSPRREVMADSKRRGVQRNSSRSLNCLELLRDEQDFDMPYDDDDDDDDDDEEYNHRTYHSHAQRQLSNSSRWGGDNESTTPSRWSASTGTGASRSMNTTQLEQLSTVPRFPRRQRTGEDLKELRRSQHSTDTNNATPESLKSNSYDNNDQEILITTEGGIPAEPGGGGGMNNSSNTNPTPKKRPQIPNRQKSFRRNVMTMNQVAQNLAQKQQQHANNYGAGPGGILSSPTNANHNNAGGQQQLSPLQKPPIMPRRTTSADTTLSGNFGKQRSLPNLYSDGSRKRQPGYKKPYSIEALSLSLSNHSTADDDDDDDDDDYLQQPILHKSASDNITNGMDASTPRLPQRQASGYDNPLGGGSQHTSRSQHSRIRRARSDGAARNAGKQAMISPRYGSPAAAAAAAAADEFSATTASSSTPLMMTGLMMPDESESTTNLSVSQTTFAGQHHHNNHHHHSPTNSMMNNSSMMNNNSLLNNSAESHETGRSRLSNFHDSCNTSCGSPKMPRRQISHDTTTSANTDAAYVGIPTVQTTLLDSPKSPRNKKGLSNNKPELHQQLHDKIMTKSSSHSSSRRRMLPEATIQESLETSFSVFESDEDDDDDDDDDSHNRSRLPHHLLRSNSGGPNSLRKSITGALDSSARLPLRQVSLTEHDEDGADGEMNFFKTAATLLGQQLEDDDDDDDVGGGGKMSFDSSARLPLRQLSLSEHDCMGAGGGGDDDNIFKSASTLLGKEPGVEEEEEEAEEEIDDKTDDDDDAEGQKSVAKGGGDEGTDDEKKTATHLEESNSQVEEQEQG